MDAKDRFAAGDVNGAIGLLVERLRSRPTDTQARAFLFELLCFAGDFDRALKHLDVLAGSATDAAVLAGLEGRGQLVAAERHRQSVFAGTTLPRFVMAPPASTEHYVLLLSRLIRGEAVADAYEQALEQLPTTAGTVDGVPFEACRDADDRLAPVLECFYDGSYVWLPWSQLERIELTAPAQLCDLLWMPARVVVRGQPAGDVHIPALYVNSHLATEVGVALGRQTAWSTVQGGMTAGAGQRIFMTDETEYPLLDLRELSFTQEPAVEVERA